jgi:6-phosphofructokinase 1
MPSIVIAQGGGPTAVINQTLCGAILAARRHEFWARAMACEASR